MLLGTAYLSTDRPLREALTWAQTDIDGERHVESITLETVQKLVIRLWAEMWMVEAMLVRNTLLGTGEGSVTQSQRP